jgi:hypothetical protein
LDGGIGPLELFGPCARYRVLKKKLSLVFVIEAADKNRKNVNIQATT